MNFKSVISRVGTADADLAIGGDHYLRAAVLPKGEGEGKGKGR